jgi:copper chaperone CopZ
MKTIIITLVFGFFAANFSFAETVNVKVNGMVCAFCAQGIKKKFEGNNSIESVDVNLDSKIVKVVVKKENKLSDEEIKKSITEAGYVVEKIERTK